MNIRQKLERGGLCFIILVALFFQGISVQASTSTAPILVVVNGNQTYKWGRYLGEILRAEGLNEYDLIDISAMTAGGLASYPLVILAQTALTGSQASTLTAYVNNGGRLIAMRPDSQIKALFGLGNASGTQNNGYLKIDDTATLDGVAPGAGLVTDTLQIHGSVDLYGSGSYTTLAQLYSNATNATSYPAVVGATYGSGRGVAFLYDLPSNVILMRQGNPANAGVDVDGDGVYRTVDLFQTQGGGAPWVDLNKVPIPQADIQQRLFARLVNQLAGAALPLPQLWYFPGTTKTMMVLTGDSHANPTSYYQYELASIASHGGKITIYLSVAAEPTDASVQSWSSQYGDTFGVHPYAYHPDPDPAFNVTNLTQGYSVVNGWFTSTYSSPKSPTVRNHQVAWLGWTDAADLAVSYQIAMDTSFYHWGPWLQKSDGTWAHGYITGSGQPMKFIRSDGTILPEYQQLTELVDEQMILSTDTAYEGLTGQEGVAVSQQMIDASQSGYYEALMTQNHVDYYGNGDPQVWAEGTLDYAHGLGIPLWNADEWLSFTGTRHDANYSNVAWNGSNNQLTFNLSSASTAGVSLTTMLPMTYSGMDLQSVSVDGSSKTYQQETINGANLAFVSVAAGNHSFSVKYLPQGPQADVSIDVSGSPNPVIAGQSLIYTINASNAGPSDASGVTVTDPLPAGVTYKSAAGTGWSCALSSGTVTCTRTTLGITSTPATITVDVTVNPDTRGSLSNTASVSANEPDPSLANNSSTISTSVEAQAALSIVKSGPGSVNAGGDLAYTLSVSNAGPSTADSLTVTDTLPAGTTFVSASGTGWTCGESSGVVTCALSSLAKGNANDISITLQAPAQGGPISNSATLAATSPVADLTSNTVTTEVLAADLSIQGTVHPDPVEVGGTLTYTLNVNNAGPSAAAHVQVASTLPAGMSIASVSGGAAWDCSASTSTVLSCTLNSDLTVAPADPIIMEVNVPDQTGLVTSTFAVSSDTPDFNSGNNSTDLKASVSILYFYWFPLIDK